MQWRTWFLMTITGATLLAACAAPAMPAKPAASDTMTASPVMTDTMAMTDSIMMTDTHMMTDTMMMTDTHVMTDSAMTTPAETMMQALPVWQTMALTNARTGATFTLADFAGQHVFVETMATWCHNCQQQLGHVKSAAERVDEEQVVFVALSVETDLAPATLAQYADDHGFDWTFVVATPELVRALAETFGQTIANPPATPHFLLHPDGSHSELVTGFESGDQILANLTP